MHYSELKQRLDVVQKEIATITDELIAYPNGILHCYRCKKYTKWFVQYPHRREFIPMEKRKSLVPMARGTYLQAKLKDLKVEEKAILAYLSIKKSDTSYVDKPLKEPEFYDLVRDFASNKTAEIREWANEPYEKWDGYPEQLVHETIHGFNTRSKSESMIADALTKRGIPYRYEQELHLDGKVYRPDFTIKHPLSGKLFYWEHLGKMDDWDYVQDNMQKMKRMAIHKIIPGINLIITSETMSNPLSQATIEKMIDLYFGVSVL